ncbi:MAG: hypothetical protein H8D56_21430 [Planctomycetes bacterium]|nr:hypothetical protein [Planctomycetota bacterium]MBL7145270.1 hypothetical protein [Phycisphaerae bacterium]
MIVIDGVTVCDVYHTDQLINARTVDVFAREVVIAIVFSDNVTSVIYVPGSIAVDILLSMGLEVCWYLFSESFSGRPGLTVHNSCLTLYAIG